MSDFEHLVGALGEKCRRLSEQERIDQLTVPRWLGYPRAKEIDTRLEWLFAHPRVTRMPNMLLIGRTNNGKSELVERFAARHLPSDNPGGEHIIVPVLSIQTPPKPNEVGLYTEMLHPLLKRLPHGTVADKRARAVEILRKVQLKVLILDEMHNMLSLTAPAQREFLNAVKYLTNELQISIVGVGDDTLISAVSIDSQIQNRFPPEILPKWKVGSEFNRLLASFEKILPLRNPSNLYDSMLAMKLAALCEGTIGELSLLLNKASVYAISSGQEQITADVLNKCGYVPPSERKMLGVEI
ncbi:TniB family NTP-binding protein [Pseudomonas sp. NPDC090202]|uniref:TniB family NTP-binding protein n=1 Tax=Pseudomonas sp. NPDC090202 TaxID=3364476 RepID=UPI0038086649